MFHWRISLNLVVLLLVVIFASRFRLELMYISLIVSIRSNLIHLHGLQLLVLLSLLIEVTFCACTDKINLLNLKQSSERLVIMLREFLKLPKLHGVTIKILYGVDVLLNRPASHLIFSFFLWGWLKLNLTLLLDQLRLV